MGVAATQVDQVSVLVYIVWSWCAKFRLHLSGGVSDESCATYKRLQEGRHEEYGFYGFVKAKVTVLNYDCLIVHPLGPAPRATKVLTSSGTWKPSRLLWLAPLMDRILEPCRTKLKIVLLTSC